MSHLNLDQIVDLRVRYSTAMLNHDQLVMGQILAEVWEAAARSDRPDCPSTLAQIEALHGAWMKGVDVRIWAAQQDPVNHGLFSEVRSLMTSPDEWAERTRERDEIGQLIAVHGILENGPTQAKLEVAALLARDLDLKDLTLSAEYEQVHSIRIDTRHETRSLNISSHLSVDEARRTVRSALEVDLSKGSANLDITAVRLLNAEHEVISKMDFDSAKMQWSPRVGTAAVVPEVLQKVEALWDALENLRKIQPTFEDFESLRNESTGKRQEMMALIQSHHIVGHFEPNWSAAPSEVKSPSLENLAQIPALLREAQNIYDQSAASYLPDEFREGERRKVNALELKAQGLINAARVIPEIDSVQSQPGEMYSGPIHSVSTDYVLQIDTATDRLIRHETRCLAGAQLSPGDRAEVRYPHGRVGLVTHVREIRSRSIEHSFNQGMRGHQAQQEMER